MFELLFADVLFNSLNSRSDRTGMPLSARGPATSAAHAIASGPASSQAPGALANTLSWNAELTYLALTALVPFFVGLSVVLWFAA